MFSLFPLFLDDPQFICYQPSGYSWQYLFCYLFSPLLFRRTVLELLSPRFFVFRRYLF